MIKKRTRFYLLEKNKASGLAFSVTVAIYLLVALIFSAIVQIMSAERKSEYGYLIFYLSFFLSVPVILLSLITTFELTGYNGHDFLKFGSKPINILPVMLIFIGSFLALNRVNDLVVELLGKIGYTENGASLPAWSVYDYVECIVIICFLPAVMEEALFRGVILNGIKGGKIAAIVVSALSFALYHMSPAKTVYQFLMGVIFAVVFLKTDGLFLTFLMHFLNNFTIVSLNYFAPDLFKDEALLPVYILCGAVVAAIGFLLLFVLNKDKKIINNSEKTPNNKVIGGFFAYAWLGLAACLVVFIAGFIK